MANTVYNKNIQASCSYCKFAWASSSLEYILCRFRGPVSADKCCRKYKYDPLKRIPRTPAELQTFDGEDFTL